MPTKEEIEKELLEQMSSVLEHLNAEESPQEVTALTGSIGFLTGR